MNTQEKEKVKIAYLKGKSMRAIGLELGYDPSTIKRALVSLGVPIRTRKEQNMITNGERRKAVDDQYFADITSVNQAWLLGFVAADGTVSSKDNRIKIALSSVDREILEKIKEYVGIERPILDSVTAKGFAVSELSWTSPAHKEQLAKFGIVPRKTYLPLSLPKFSNPDLIKAFILGYFDGDGSISVSKDGYIRFRIGSYRAELLKEIADFIGHPHSLSKCKDREYYEYSISGKYAVSTLKSLYNLNSIRLDRKYQVFLEYINQETATSDK